MKALFLFPSFHSHRAPLLAKIWKESFREPILPGWCPPGFSPETISNQLQPRSHVLSPRSVTVARQSDCPSCAVWPERSQPTHNSPEILLSGKRAQWSLCCGLVSGCLSVILSDILPCCRFPFISQSGERRECISKLFHIREEYILFCTV